MRLCLYPQLAWTNVKSPCHAYRAHCASCISTALNFTYTFIYQLTMLRGPKMLGFSIKGHPTYKIMHMLTPHHKDRVTADIIAGQNKNTARQYASAPAGPVVSKPSHICNAGRLNHSMSSCIWTIQSFAPTLLIHRHVTPSIHFSIKIYKVNRPAYFQLRKLTSRKKSESVWIWGKSLQNGLKINKSATLWTSWTHELRKLPESLHPCYLVMINLQK